MCKALELAWQSLGHLLEDITATHADATLFIYEGDAMTYAAFNQRVNQLANSLTELGIGKGVRVSIMLPNGFEFPTAWFALAKLGAVMVPTNIHYAERDLHYVLSDSEAKAIVIHQDYLKTLLSIEEALPDLQHVVVLDGIDELPYTPDDVQFHDYQTLIEHASDTFVIQDVQQSDLRLRVRFLPV